MSNTPKTIWIGKLPEHDAHSLEWYRTNEWGENGLEYRLIDGCLWAYLKHEECYVSTCGQSHVFMIGDPKENDYKFCPYCGDKILIGDGDG